MFRKLSIRYKIMLLLFSISMSVLVLYLFFAVNIFQKDKIAYVFDSSSAVAKTLAAQVTTELKSILDIEKNILQEYLNTRTFGVISNTLIKSDPKLNWIVAYSRPNKESSFERKNLIEHQSGAFEGSDKDFVKNNFNFLKLLDETNQKTRMIINPFDDDRFLFTEKVTQEDGQEEVIFVIQAQLTELASNFKNSTGTAEIYLINETGKILFGSTGLDLMKITDILDEETFSMIRSKELTDFTKEIKSKTGVQWLASGIKTGIENLSVISLVDKMQALSAIQDLLRMSIILALLLISGVIVVGIIASGSLTASLTELFNATRQVAEGHFDIHVDIKSHDEVGSLGESFNTMAKEVSRLIIETAEKGRMETELKTARTVQETLFPPTEARIGNIHIVGFYEPASECGGDWWHYSKIGDKILFCIGDATGHGVPAALITSAAKSAATIIERLNTTPEQSLNLLNRAIYDVSKGRIMMTFFLALYDQKTNEFCYANASHDPPYLLKKNDKPLTKKQFIPLNEVNDSRLGQDRDTTYSQTSFTLDPGDRIVFYTDGLSDVQNPEKVKWGDREFIKAIIEANKDNPPIDQSVQSLVSKLQSYRQKSPLVDDVTFFMCHYTNNTEQSTQSI